jgi:hypothetical protein
VKFTAGFHSRISGFHFCAASILLATVVSPHLVFGCQFFDFVLCTWIQRRGFSCWDLIPASRTAGRFLNVWSSDPFPTAAGSHSVPARLLPALGAPKAPPVFLVFTSVTECALVARFWNRGITHRLPAWVSSTLICFGA